MSILSKFVRKEMRARAKLLLTLVGLQDRMDHLPSELSGRQQSDNCPIAGDRSDILLLDEPTKIWTRNTIDTMNLLLKASKRRGKRPLW